MRSRRAASISLLPSRYSNASLASQPPQLRLKPAPVRRIFGMGDLGSTNQASVSIVIPASRVGLTPSPTCLTGQGGLPQGDAATFGNETVARAHRPSSEQNRWRVFLCL